MTLLVIEQMQRMSARRPLMRSAFAVSQAVHAHLSDRFGSDDESEFCICRMHGMPRPRHGAQIVLGGIELRHKLGTGGLAIRNDKIESLNDQNADLILCQIINPVGGSDKATDE